MPSTAISSPSFISVWRPDCRPAPSSLERHRRGLLLMAVLLALLWSPLAAGARLLLLLCWLLLGLRLLRLPDGTACLKRFQQTPTGWRLQLASGEWVTARLSGPVRDWQRWLQLGWVETDQDPSHRPRHWRISLWRDQLPAEDWRRLRVSLRWPQPGTSTVSTAAGKVSG